MPPHSIARRCRGSGEPPIVLAQMKTTSPCQNAVEAPAEREPAHVRQHPFRFRKARAAELDHRRRGVHAEHAESAVDEVAGDWLAHPATHVENGASGRDMRKKPIEPCAFLKRPVTILVVLQGMPLVEVNHGIFAHVR